MSWQVSTSQWLEWIANDGQVAHQRWISCDDFDEDLRRRLETHPFLGTSENTVVGRHEETMMTQPPLPGPDSFDSMATVVRMAPEGLMEQDAAPDTTLVSGQVPTEEDTAAQLSDEIEVSVEGGGYEVALEASDPTVAAVPARSGQTLKTEPVPVEEGAPQPVDADHSDPSRASDAAVAPTAAEDGELFIPVLVRSPEGPDPSTESAPSDLATDETVAAQEPEPPKAQLEAVPEAQVEAAAEPVQEAPATPSEEAEDAAVAEPVSPSSSGTMVVVSPDPSELEAQPQSGQTVIVQTPYEQPPAADRTVIAPEPQAPQPEPAAAEVPSEPVAAEPVSDSGIIEAAPHGAAEELAVPDAEDKVVVDAGAPADVATSDSDEIDAIDIVEEALEVEEVEADDAQASSDPPPPTPPPAAAAPPTATEAAAPAPAEASRKSAARKVAGWYDDVFAEHFAALRRKSLGKTAKADIEFFVQSSGLSPGARILDVGCGDGAHSIILAQRGYTVTSVDNSSSQLERATAASKQLGVQVDFRAADMRDMDLGTYDGIICMGTTFGYFDDDVNRSVLRRLRDHLEPGGKMLLQVVNRDYISPRLPSRSWWQGHGCLVLDEAEMNYFTNRMHIHRTIVFEDGRQFEHNMVVRGYGAYELGRLCVDTGLRVHEISGSRHTRSKFWGATSPEIWLLVGRS